MAGAAEHKPPKIMGILPEIQRSTHKHFGLGFIFFSGPGLLFRTDQRSVQNK
jgi:hypothetical protein